MFWNVDKEFIKGKVVVEDVVEHVGATTLVNLVLENYKVLGKYDFSKASMLSPMLEVKLPNRAPLVLGSISVIVR